MIVLARMIRHTTHSWGNAKMDYDTEWLKEFIKKRTLEVWKDSKKPYYLSFIATDLSKNNADYKPIIAPLRLRQWATVTDIDGLKLVVHSKHKAKVGYIPENVEYSFNDEESVKSSEDTVASTNKLRYREADRRPLFSLLESLSKLSNEELETVHIPVKIFVRLFKN